MSKRSAPPEVFRDEEEEKPPVTSLQQVNALVRLLAGARLGEGILRDHPLYDRVLMRAEIAPLLRRFQTNRGIEYTLHFDAQQGYVRLRFYWKGESEQIYYVWREEFKPAPAHGPRPLWVLDAFDFVHDREHFTARTVTLRHKTTDGKLVLRNDSFELLGDMPFYQRYWVRCPPEDLRAFSRIYDAVRQHFLARLDPRDLVFPAFAVQLGADRLELRFLDHHRAVEGRFRDQAFSGVLVFIDDDGFEINVNGRTSEPYSLAVNVNSGTSGLYSLVVNNRLEVWARGPIYGGAVYDEDGDGSFIGYGTLLSHCPPPLYDAIFCLRTRAGAAATREQTEECIRQLRDAGLALP